MFIIIVDGFFKASMSEVIRNSGKNLLPINQAIITAIATMFIQVVIHFSKMNLESVMTKKEMQKAVNTG